MQADPLAINQLGQVSPLLLLRAEGHQRDDTGPQVCIQREQKSVVLPSVAQGLEGTNCGQRIRAATTVFLWSGQSLNAEVGTLLPELAGKFLLPIPSFEIVVQFLLGKPDNFLAKGRLFFRP